MEEKSRYTLQRTMLVYFLLIAFASLLVGIEFIADTNSQTLRMELTDNFERYSQDKLEINEVFRPIEKIRNKAILMIAIIMVVMGIVLTMFIKNITEPLQYIIDTAKKISSGDLRFSVEVQSKNELAELGNVMNELSSNFQETAMFSRKLCQIGSDSVSDITTLLDEENLEPETRKKITEKLDILKEEMVSLENLLSCFQFYNNQNDE